MLWKPIDAIAEWIQNGVDVAIQQRIAVCAILISLPLVIIGPWITLDPAELLIYQMSAWALTISGITWLSALMGARKVDEAEESSDPLPGVQP